MVGRLLIVAALCLPLSAAAQPRPKVIHVPTGGLVGERELYGWVGGSHRLGLNLGLAAGIGRFAEFGVEWSDENSACAECSGVSAEFITEQGPRAYFRSGLPEGYLWRHQPGLVLGLERSVRAQEASESAVSVYDKASVANMYVAASKELGPWQVHGGARLWDARVLRGESEILFRERTLTERLRPFLGVEWKPSIYPKTTVLVDGSWAPLITPEGASLRWLLGWGVRYQAFSSTGFELLVRHREGDSLRGSTVLVRMNARLGY